MKHILIIVGILALLGAGYWVSRRSSENVGAESAPSPSATATSMPSASVTSTPSATPKPPVKKAAPTPKPSTLQQVETYQDALQIYGTSGYRFQFAANCQASPGGMTIKAGEKFMLDNRDGTPRALVVGATAYNVGAYGFAIAKAPAAAGAYNILCEGSNRALLTVQP